MKKIYVNKNLEGRELLPEQFMAEIEKKDDKIVMVNSYSNEVIDYSKNYIDLYDDKMKWIWAYKFKNDKCFSVMSERLSKLEIESKIGIIINNYEGFTNEAFTIKAVYSLGFTLDD